MTPLRDVTMEFEICECGKFAFMMDAESLTLLPAGYYGELCPDCGLFMCAVDKLELSDRSNEMNAILVANQAYEYITNSGRMSYDGEQKVKTIGIKKFLEDAAKRWELEGRQDFIHGMAKVMLKMVGE